MESLIHQIVTGITGPLPLLVAAVVVGLFFSLVATGVAGRVALYVEELRHVPSPVPARSGGVSAQTEEVNA